MLTHFMIFNELKEHRKAFDIYDRKGCQKFLKIYFHSHYILFKKLSAKLSLIFLYGHGFILERFL